MKLALLALVIALPLLAQPRQQDVQGTCRDSQGQDIKCSDGHYHAADGSVQPDTCDNNATTDPVHKCECAIATTDAAHCPPGGIKRDYQGMGPKCKVSCREKACRCINECDANDDMPPVAKPKPAPKKKGK